MEVGLLPALGSGVGDLRRAGQHSRLIEGYFVPYTEAFDAVWYFSYLPEAIADYTDDPRLLTSVRFLAPRRREARLLRAGRMPWAHRETFRRCAVLRVFQITGVIPALIARALWGVPYVTTYGFWYARLSRPGPTRPVKRLLERVGLRCAAAVLVTTEELRAHVARLTRAPVHLVPNGVDTARFMPGERRPGTTRRVVYVGRLEPEKNLGALLAAAATLAGRMPLRVTFVGDGSLAFGLRAQAEALGVRAEFAGVVDHHRLPEHLRGADVFVLPSFTEGHPKALIEAMAAGLPCVTSDCAGNRSLIADGQTGLLFDPASPEALAIALERVLSDEELAACLGRQARALVVRRYDLRALVGEEIRILKSVAAVPAP